MSFLDTVKKAGARTALAAGITLSAAAAQAATITFDNIIPTNNGVEFLSAPVTDSATGAVATTTDGSVFFAFGDETSFGSGNGGLTEFSSTAALQISGAFNFLNSVTVTAENDNPFTFSITPNGSATQTFNFSNAGDTPQTFGINSMANGSFLFDFGTENGALAFNQAAVSNNNTSPIPLPATGLLYAGLIAAGGAVAGRKKIGAALGL